MRQDKPRVRRTPNGQHRYTATLRGYGTYGWGDTPEQARARLAENIAKSGETRKVGQRLPVRMS